MSILHDEQELRPTAAMILSLGTEHIPHIPHDLLNLEHRVDFCLRPSERLQLTEQQCRGQIL